MHKIHKVREMLCGELESYSNKEKIDIQSLDMIDKLSHAIKNIDKIIDREEMIEYSNYSNGNSMRGNSNNSYGNNNNSYGNPYYEDMSYRRGRDSMGRYSREGYSRDEEYNPNMYRRM